MNKHWRTETEWAQVRIGSRERLAQAFPASMQPLITSLTGKSAGERPYYRNTSSSAAAVTLAALGGGILLGALEISAWDTAGIAGRLALMAGIPFSILIAAGAARGATSTILHHSTHLSFEAPAFWTAFSKTRFCPERLRGRKGWNRLIGEVISTIVLVAPFDHYDRDHRKHHGADDLATWKDPDWRFLFEAGFLPGQKRSSYRRALGSALLSPRFHGRFLTARLRDNLFNRETPRYRRSMAWTYIAGLGTIFSATYTLFGASMALALAVAWIVPIVPLNQVGALLQLLTEHRWLRLPDSPDRKIRLARKTRGRFVAPDLPSVDAQPVKALAWGIWWLRMLFIDFPVVRLWIWANDLGSHDWHHRHPGSRDWPNSAQARSLDIAAGHPGFSEPYDEVWGISGAITEVFDLLSSLPELTDAIDKLPAEEFAEMLRLM